jgi:hypothetical protein
MGAILEFVRQNGTDEPPDFWVIAALVDGLAERAGLTPVGVPPVPEEVEDIR